MNPQLLRNGGLALAAVLVLGLVAALFTVQQTQQALVLQFGRVRSVITEPGLHLKLPFIENVVTIDKRVLDLDLPVQTILSTDRQNLEVDAFARYRITDPLRFYQSVNNVQVANQRLTSFVNAATRQILASASQDAIIRTERSALTNRIQADVNRQAATLGVEIVDLRLTRVDLPAVNSEAVYRRMATERQREATEVRAEGNQRAASIRAKADRDVTVVLAEANRRNEELRGTGDAEKNRILAEAFGRDPEFFSFFRSMQAYEAGLKAGDTRLVLSPSSDFFRFFNDPNGRARGSSTPPAPPAGPPPPPAGSGTSAQGGITGSAAQ